MNTPAADLLDVLIVGAGLSGIGAACRLAELKPAVSYAVLEARDATGGTWDLFRYPGIRSDSDMFTLSYPFNPWGDASYLASGESILSYLRETASAYGVDQHIRLGHKAIAAEWDTGRGCWTVRSRTAGGEVEQRARFLYVCSGYYSYDRGHVVDFPGQASFAGEVIHPQFWPEGLDVTDQRIVVIGSGATAITLIPALTDQGASKVTMLQRSPTYIVSVPSRDAIGSAAFRFLPLRAAQQLIRGKNIVVNTAMYELCRAFPRAARASIAAGAARYLGKAAVNENFTPAYEPWDQRLCVVPDGDFYAAIRDGRADVVTDTIDTFETAGVRVSSGQLIEADIVVTATGLKLQPMGGITVAIDGDRIEPSERFAYKGLMLDGIPNFAMCLGYTNNSWTLRADLSSRFVAALVARLQADPALQVAPDCPGGIEEGDPPFHLKSGYIQRAAGLLPKQGRARPWTARQNYLLDRRDMRLRTIEDSYLKFRRRTPQRGRERTPVSSAS